MKHIKRVLLKRLQIQRVALLAVSLIMVGCNRDESTVYTVPKEKAVAATPMSSSMKDPNADVPVNAAPIRWTTPDSWKELAPTSIRLGNFQVPGENGKQAEVAITSFPGSVGTELDNWNRWRREVNLDSTGEGEMTSQKVTVGSAEGKLYDIVGPEASSVVAVLSRQGASWFFKLRGDKNVVSQAKPTFIEFLKSIEFEAPDASKTPRVAKQTADDPHAGLTAPSANAKPEETQPEEEQSDLPKWNVPSNWTEKPAGMMVLKTYAVANDKTGSAVVAISQFPGDVGGTLANVNRWRGQLGLAPIKESEHSANTTTVDTAAGKATFVDFKGTDAKTGKPARMVAGMVPQADKTWFYKMTGDDAVVGAEKEAFTKFVKDVRY